MSETEIRVFDYSRFGALYYAVYDEVSEAAFLAVLRGCADAEVKYRNSDGRTVLMQLAVYQDWPKAAAALIERGCDVNATSSHGTTALLFAGLFNRRETTRVLLERGADRTIKNYAGETAEALAQSNGHADLAACIDDFDSAARLFHAASQGKTEALLQVLLLLPPSRLSFAAASATGSASSR